jgi:hypothetical protein
MLDVKAESNHENNICFALKGQPNLAQGNALGTSEKKSDRNPVRVAPSSDDGCLVTLSGLKLRFESKPRVLPWAELSSAFGVTLS